MIDNISIDLRHNTIENLFFRQIKMLSIEPRKAKQFVSGSFEEIDDDLYCEEGLDSFIDGDEINTTEEAFMKGYINA